MSVNGDVEVIILGENLEVLVQMRAYGSMGTISLTRYEIALFPLFSHVVLGFYRGISKVHLLSDLADLEVYCSLKMWESIILQGRCGGLLASRGDVGVFKLCLSGSVGIQVSCSAEDHSAVRDGRFPVSKYSRTSLYIADHLPHLK